MIPHIMGSMRNWLHELDEPASPNTEQEKGERVAVVHCKAGKGRSGTVACAYLISQEGWKKEDALQRFTERRMRVGFGNGVSIPSQLRYIGYIDRWANQMGKEYVERPVEILEIHVWGLRDGVKVAVEGFVDEGKKIKCFHLFHRDERTVVSEGGLSSEEQGSSKGSDTDTSKSKPRSKIKKTLTGNASSSSTTRSPMASGSDISATTTSPSHKVSAMIFKPHEPIIIPSSDVNIDFERRSKASYTGFAMVTSIAHVWFNPYFEGGAEHDSGVFETEWDAMDGVKGSIRKGIRALDKLKVVWRYPAPETVEGSAAYAEEAKGKKNKYSAPAEGRPISQPKPGDPIEESHPADWRGMPDKDQENEPPIEAVSHKSTAASISGKTKELGHTLEKELGLRKKTTESTDVSLAGSDDDTKIVTDEEGRRVKVKKSATEGLEGVKTNYEKKGEDQGKK
jgi:protein-tyrosine phosphatase